MIQEYQLRVLPEVAANEQQLKTYLNEEKGLNLRDITATRILKRSIDARQRTIFVNLTVRVYLNETPDDDENQGTNLELTPASAKAVRVPTRMANSTPAARNAETWTRY